MWGLIQAIIGELQLPWPDKFCPSGNGSVLYEICQLHSLAPGMPYVFKCSNSDSSHFHPMTFFYFFASGFRHAKSQQLYLYMNPTQNDPRGNRTLYLVYNYPPSPKFVPVQHWSLSDWDRSKHSTRPYLNIPHREKYRTCFDPGDLFPFECIVEFAGDDLQLYFLLFNDVVGFVDVDLHFGVVDLMHVAILLDKSLVPAITNTDCTPWLPRSTHTKTPDICANFFYNHTNIFAYIYLHFLKNSHFNLTLCVNFYIKLHFFKRSWLLDMPVWYFTAIKEH